MKNGKVLEFIKNHWFSLASLVVVGASVCFGIYSCTRGASVDINTKGNRVIVKSAKS